MKYLQLIVSLALTAVLVSIGPAPSVADDDWGAEETDENEKPRRRTLRGRALWAEAAQLNRCVES